MENLKGSSYVAYAISQLVIVIIIKIWYVLRITEYYNGSFHVNTIHASAMYQL